MKKARSPAPWNAAPGCFELAQHGTLLLDELGEMPVGTQAKLLRVLEDSCVRRLGGKTEIAVDVRVIASTNKVLEEALRKGELREDLYYRLNVFQITLPALRQREGDLPLLTEALIETLNHKHDTRVVDVQPGCDGAVQALLLAGQRSRIAQRAGARRHPGGRRHHHRASSAARFRRARGRPASAARLRAGRRAACPSEPPSARRRSC